MSHIPTGRALLDAERILQNVPLASGMVYADFGCGNVGHFVFPAAQMVGETGHVYAVDILKKALESITKRAQREGFHQVTTVWGDLERPRGVNIPSDFVHVISLVHLTDLLQHSPFVIEEVKRLLHDQGMFLVIDWKERQKDRIIYLLMAAGFRFKKSFVAGPHHWGLLFSR